MISPSPSPANDIRQADALDLLASVEPGSAQIVITDPPYGIAFHSNRYKDKNPHAPIAGDWNFQIGSFLAAAERSLTDSGAVYLFTRWDVYPLWAKEIPPTLTLKNAIVWDKGAHSSGDLDGNFGGQYELILFLTKGRHTRRGYRWSNIWGFPRIPAKRMRMAAEKPVGLYVRAIESSSDAGDLVVDPFCGSGTCAEASRATGRRYLCGDTDPKMLAMARRRVGLPVIDDTPPISSMPSCPVFRVIPPDPSLWGLHPEDLAYATEGLYERNRGAA